MYIYIVSNRDIFYMDTAKIHINITVIHIEKDSRYYTHPLHEKDREKEREERHRASSEGAGKGVANCLCVR